MKVYFADTSYYVALLVPQDRFHAKAMTVASDPNVTVVTTDYVLLELAAFFAKPPFRAHVVQLVEELRRATNLTIRPARDEPFARGWEEYRRHADKSWSLTDCICFVLMRELKLTEALTTDHHFEQAGFTALLKP